jgi:IclR family KDG regulon transcriptional repressor
MARTNNEEPDNLPATRPVRATEPYMNRVVNVLECLSQGICTITDIARQCRISASSTHKVLSALIGPDLVIYDPVNHRYYLGPTVNRLSSNPVTSHRFLIMVAKDEMSRLSSIFKESVTLDVMLGISFIPLHAIYSVNRMEFIEREVLRDSRLILPLGSVDKVLLSQLSNAKLGQTMKMVKPQIEAAKLKMDADSLKQLIEQIRQQGYAITHAEKNPDGYGISVPIQHYTTPAALTMFGPESSAENFNASMIQEMLRSAKHISDVIYETLHDSDKDIC